MSGAVGVEQSDGVAVVTVDNPPVNALSDAVLEALSFQPRHVDEVIGEAQLPTARISSALMLLEMKGLVRRFPGNTYVRL